MDIFGGTRGTHVTGLLISLLKPTKTDRVYMTSKARTPVGDNERIFEALFEEQAPRTPLLGKRRFSRGKVQISVDQSFTHARTT